MTVAERSDNEVQYVVVYDIASTEFRKLPAIQDGWVPVDPVYSNDRSQVAVGALCLHDCSDADDRTRIMAFDLSGEEWRTVVSGQGWQSGPVFLPGDQEILLVRGRLLDPSFGFRLRVIDPEPAIASLATGEFRTYSVDNAEFFKLFGLQFGPGPRIYFRATGPSAEGLKAQIQQQNNSSSDISILPYYISLDGSLQLSKSGKYPSIFEEILTAARIPEVTKFEVSSLTGRVLFTAAKVIGERRYGEQYYVYEGGVLRESIATGIQTNRLSLSADGKTALILGDPERRGFEGGFWDVFLLDVDRDALVPLPLRSRVNENLNRVLRR